MKYRYACMSMVSAMSLLQAGVAFAQDAADEEAIVVTAQKREQQLIDVPMSITVLSGEELAERGVSTIQDLSFNVPGLTMREDGPGSYQIFLRGLSNAYGGGAQVSVYSDETPLSLDGYTQLSPVPLDVARIEVLKGPQGTLYGEGASAGTIRYVTNAPNLNDVEGRFGGEAYSVSDGELGTRVTGVFNLPIVDDRLALRVAMGFEQGGGWIDQPEAGIENGNGTELVNARARLLWRISDNFDAELSANVHRAETQLGLGYEEADRTNEVGIDRSNVLNPKVFDFTTYGLTLNYDLGAATLVSATNYVEHHHEYPTSYIPREGNFSFGFVEGTDDRQNDAERFSQEVRLTSNDDKRFDWTIGAFYSNYTNDFYDVYQYIYTLNGGLYTGGPSFLVTDLLYINNFASETYSLFADASFELTDRFEIGAGIRYFHDAQEEELSFGGPFTSESGDFESVDPRVYASFETSPRTRLYASVAKGFRSGGFNLSTGLPGFEPESVVTYELGSKGELGGGAFQYDLAIYHTDYSDMVRRGLVLVNGGFLQNTSNIGEATIDGVEGGFTWRATPSITLSSTAAYLQTEITEVRSTDAINVEGDPLDYAPEWSYTLGANYDFSWASSVPGFARIDFIHRDEVTYIDRSAFFASALPQSSDELNLLNARLGATVNGVEMQLYGLNLTDENASIDPYQAWANANRTRPRVIGVSFGYDF